MLKSVHDFTNKYASEDIFLNLEIELTKKINSKTNWEL